MKRRLTGIFAFALIGIIFNSCKKDNENTNTYHSITLNGEFTVGDKSFVNPTFNLSLSKDFEGFLRSVDETPDYEAISITKSDIDLGDNIFLHYDIDIESANTGNQINTYAYIFIKKLGEESGLNFICYDAKSTVTKIGSVGGYIEGTYGGDILFQGINETLPFSGKFRVKRIEEPLDK